MNPDLLLCMKLVAFRANKITDLVDINNMLKVLKSSGVPATVVFDLVVKYYDNMDVLPKEAIEYVRGYLGDFE